MHMDYKFIKVHENPIFDISPHHVRMSCCYMDKSGKYHMFADYIDSSLHTVHSFQAVLNYYTSTDLIAWTDHGTIIKKGNYNYETRTGDPDCYGIGSPDVLCTDEYIYLFYAGRGVLAPNQPFNGLAHSGEPGYVSSEIMYAIAPTDKYGAPSGPFIKKGVVFKQKYEWESMRRDDPCVVLEQNLIHLYYKGFNDNSNRDNIKLGYASADIKNFRFIENPEPILSVSGGLEMPRVFIHKGNRNMFLRHFSPIGGTVWRHYISLNGITWTIKNPCLFNCAGPNPGKGAADLMLIKNFDGSLTGNALACGLENGVLKLWLYKIIES